MLGECRQTGCKSFTILATGYAKAQNVVGCLLQQGAIRSSLSKLRRNWPITSVVILTMCAPASPWGKTVQAAVCPGAHC